MNSLRNPPHRFAALGLPVLAIAFCSHALHAAVTLNETDAFVVSGTPSGDLIVSGDLSVVQAIDFGVTTTDPALAAVQLNYFGGGVNAAMTDLTTALGTFQWRDNLAAAARNKMTLDGGNLLTLYKSDGTGAGILLNPNTGQVNLSGTGSGIYAGGTPVFSIGPTGNLLFGNRPFNIPATTPSSSSTTGALTVAGGLGVAMDSYINGIRVGKGGGNVAANTAYGVNVLQANTTGSSNTAMGCEALYSNTTGSSNTATGYDALRANTTGYYNTAAGSYSLYANTSGYYNTAVGTMSLYANTTGYYNTAAGYLALYANTTGYYNTATGYYALRANTSGYYNTAAGCYSLAANTTGGSNTASGYMSLYANTTGSANTASGIYALRANTTGSANSATGYYSLGCNTTGGNNTASGYMSLYANTTGYYNTASGYMSLYANTTGISNTATGNYALYVNTTGSSNAAYSYAALQANTTGSSNTAAGYGSLSNNTTGSSNVAIGSGAGKYQANGSTSLTTANQSIYVGVNSRGFSNLDQNAIVIGASAVGEGANTTVIGNSGTLKTHLYGTVNVSALTINNAPVMTSSYGADSILANGATLALGNNSNATQQDAIAIGTGANASMNASLALGYCASAGANYATALANSSAFGESSFAAATGVACGARSIGMGADAYGDSSVAIGGFDEGQYWSNAAYGKGAVAIGGCLNAAVGNYSYAMGWNTNSLGIHSLAMGYATLSNSYATALGSRNLSTNNALLSTGDDPWLEDSTLFELGNGNPSWDDPIGASNAITTLKNGQTTLTNKEWKANAGAPLADPASGTDSGGEALVVEGHTRLKGKVIIEQAQGDISMGIYGP